MIQVVNKRFHAPTAQDAYIGRGSPLGNPYTSIKNRPTRARMQCDSPEESVRLYEAYLREKIRVRDPQICPELNRLYRMAQTGDLYLVCWCKIAGRNNVCHGDVIKQILESKLAGS